MTTNEATTIPTTTTTTSEGEPERDAGGFALPRLVESTIGVRFELARYSAKLLADPDALWHLYAVRGDAEKRPRGSQMQIFVMRELAGKCDHYTTRFVAVAAMLSPHTEATVLQQIRLEHELWLKRHKVNDRHRDLSWWVDMACEDVAAHRFTHVKPTAHPRSQYIRYGDGSERPIAQQLTWEQMAARRKAKLAAQAGNQGDRGDQFDPDDDANELYGDARERPDPSAQRPVVRAKAPTVDFL